MFYIHKNIIHHCANQSFNNIMDECILLFLVIVQHMLAVLWSQEFNQANKNWVVRFLINTNTKTSSSLKPLNPFLYPHNPIHYLCKPKLISYGLAGVSPSHWKITFHTCLLRCCPYSWCRLRSSGHTRRRVHYTGRVGNWGSPSDPPGIRRIADQTLLDGIGTGQWTCHKVESRSLPSCNHRLNRGRTGVTRVQEGGEHERRTWSGKEKKLKMELEKQDQEYI